MNDRWFTAHALLCTVCHVTLAVGVLFCSLFCSVCPRLPSLVLSLLSCLTPLVADSTASQARTEVAVSASLSASDPRSTLLYGYMI